MYPECNGQALRRTVKCTDICSRTKIAYTLMNSRFNAIIKKKRKTMVATQGNEKTYRQSVPNKCGIIWIEMIIGRTKSDGSNANKEQRPTP
jgi:hypothetical protein